ncbi:MAG: hypothetical protein BGP06_19045 [Rhizobiales bacterium 65-9]|nr:MAG: hypothetical protein BGP06_19045 [Rhizobiales bacterium 65-9]
MNMTNSIDDSCSEERPYKNIVADHIARGIASAFGSSAGEQQLAALRAAAGMGFMHALRGAIAAVYLFDEDRFPLDQIACEIQLTASYGIVMDRNDAPLVI